MAKAQKMFTFIKVDEKVPIYKLGILDMLRAIVLKMNESNKNAIKSDSAVTKKYNTLKANLNKFIHRALEPIKAGTNKSVIVAISSKYKPVMLDVLNNKSIIRFYHVKVVKPERVFKGVAFRYKTYLKLREESIPDDEIEYVKEEDL